MGLIDIVAINKAARQRRVQMIALRDRGWTLDRIGRKYGISRQRAFEILRRAGIDVEIRLPGRPRTKTENPIDWDKRRVEKSKARKAKYAYVEAEFTQGKTLQEIGTSLGVTRERVRQIIKKLGLERQDGGAHIKALINVRYRQKPENPRRFAFWGCTKQEAIDLNQGENLTKKGTPAYWFRNQQNAAIRTRGIKWEMTFAEWLRLWKDSGHWEQRGRGKGYCMARIGDSGSYSVENVEIITIGQNFSDSYISKPYLERFLNFERRPYCKNGHPRSAKDCYKNGNCKQCTLDRYAKKKATNAK